MARKKARVRRSPTPATPVTGQHNPTEQLTPQENINVKLIESGEKEKLKEAFRERLIECGWRDEMKALCRECAMKKGRKNVTLDDLIHNIAPKGRASVPDSVKAELMQQVRTSILSGSEQC